MRNRVSTLVILSSISGCVHAPPSPESLRKKNVAVIQSEGGSSILAIDGEAAVPFWEKALLPLRRRRRATLTPGEHILTVTYLRASVYDIKLKTQSGHTYFIRDDVRTGAWEMVKNLAAPVARVWITDGASGTEVGEILASVREPIANGAQVGVSPFFSWSVPEKIARPVMSRMPRRRTVAWMSPDGSEHFAVSVEVVDLPTLRDADEFFAFVRKAHHMELEKYGLSPQDGNIEILRDRADYCAKFRQAPRSRNVRPFEEFLASAVSGVVSRSTRSISEGFYCRISNDKKFGIKFKYSHLSSANRVEPQISDRAEEYFSQIKF